SHKSSGGAVRSIRATPRNDSFTTWRSPSNAGKRAASRSWGFSTGIGATGAAGGGVTAAWRGASKTGEGSAAGAGSGAVGGEVGGVAHAESSAHRKPKAVRASLDSSIRASPQTRVPASVFSSPQYTFVSSGGDASCVTSCTSAPLDLEAPCRARRRKACRHSTTTLRHNLDHGSPVLCG